MEDNHNQNSQHKCSFTLVSQAKKSAASSLVMEGGHKESSSEENKATEEDVGEALKCSEETSPCSCSATDRPNCK